MPAIVRVALVLAGSPSVPCNVIVTTPPMAVAVAPPDPVNPDTREMRGLVGIPNDAGKVTVICCPETRAPLGLDVNPMVQTVPVAPATWDEPTKVTLANPEMTTLATGEMAFGSVVVLTENRVLA
jgi:hypothetical protein